MNELLPIIRRVRRPLSVRPVAEGQAAPEPPVAIPSVETVAVKAPLKPSHAKTASNRSAR